MVTVMTVDGNINPIDSVHGFMKLSLSPVPPGLDMEKILRLGLGTRASPSGYEGGEKNNYCTVKY